MKQNETTPMMKQYNEIKQQYPDALLFYRLGDFYELFYEDAVVASKELGITLTQRHNTPMCGVPWHAHENYLAKLVKNGHRVAICEQLETPLEAKKQNKKTVDRGIVRVVTQGTLVESSILNNKANNFLMSISGIASEKIGIAYADISTGSFFVEEIETKDLATCISKISPSEIICQDSALFENEILKHLEPYQAITRPLPSAKFSQDSSQKRLTDFFKIKFIDAFGDFSICSIDAAAAIVEYTTDVYISNNVNLSYPKLVKSYEHMQIDLFTRRSLELIKTQGGTRNGSFLNSIDQTQTSQGARLLERWLMHPLLNIEAINKRLDFVEFFVSHKETVNELQSILRSFPDIERSLSRIVMNKSGPKELVAIKIALEQATKIAYIAEKFTEISHLSPSFPDIAVFINILKSALSDSAPTFTRDGGFIKEGYDNELDEYMNLLKNGNSIIKSLQMSYIEETGINSLKIKNNNVIGYFIEISPQHASKMPYKFIHRQTLGSAIRYTTSELSDIANKIYSSEASAKRREIAIFEDLCSKITEIQKELNDISQKISFIDVVSSFAKLALDNSHTRPILTHEKILNIKNGKHHVVAQHLRSVGGKFVENDSNIDDSKLVSILTGPNMGGKSTYIRQNAIIILMAQIGMFVPATSAVIGIADKIFSRVGAFDDISSGKSTFMIEMLETAAILCQATEKSFIILDEVGRGTSTYDGLSIAWAIVEEICLNIKARTIFATHYHELINIKIPNVHFLTVTVQEWNDKILFMHKISDGFIDKSYGIHVAKLAGFPKKVLERAAEILKNVSTMIQ